MRGSQASDTSLPPPQAAVNLGLATPSEGSLPEASLFPQLGPEAPRVEIGLRTCANVSSSGGQEGSLTVAGGIHVHPPTQALHVHTHGWKHFQSKSALELFLP